MPGFVSVGHHQDRLFMHTTKPPRLKRAQKEVAADSRHRSRMKDDYEDDEQF